MALPLHRLVDALAMWTEDRRRRSPVPFRPPDGSSLDCFGPLPPLPPPPPRAGTWRTPSPRPADGDGFLSVIARPADGPPRGVAILVPPWKVPTLAVLGGWERLLTRAGRDVWTLVPPRHLHRALPGERSGEGFVSPDLRVLQSSLEQLVLELRLLSALARERGGQTAMLGLSLGALGSALAATAPERLDDVGLVAPPADLAMIFAGTRIGRRYAALARRANAPIPSPEALAPLLAPFRAQRRPPTARRVFLAVGREDRIAPGAAALDLARAWGIEPHVYPRGHLTLLFACRAVRRDLARFFSGDAPAASRAAVSAGRSVMRRP